MNNLNPRVTAAITVVIIILAGIIVFKSTIGNHVGDPPPLAAGGPAAGKVTLPSPQGGMNGGPGGAPPLAGAMGGAPGAPPPMAGSNMTLPGAPPGR